MEPTSASVTDFVATTSDRRQRESSILIELMHSISGEQPVLWGPSIIGFGSVHYAYDSGREGDMPILAFSPRRSAITIYFSEGFDRYGDDLTKLGKHKTSVSCLYATKLDDIDLSVLESMLQRSYAHHATPVQKPQTVEEYLAAVPPQARPAFDHLRNLVTSTIPEAHETLSYSMIGYKKDPKKRAHVYISAWDDHLGLYPLPAETGDIDVSAYRKGKATMWIPLGDTLPVDLIVDVVRLLWDRG